MEDRKQSQELWKKILLCFFLIVYVCTFASSILSSFWPNLATFLTSHSDAIILGVFSTVGISLVWDMLMYGGENAEAHKKFQEKQEHCSLDINRVKDELNTVKQIQDKSHSLIENFASGHSSFEILENSTTHYLYFKNAMNSLKEGQSVFVTAFEKYNYTNYDSGSTPEEQNFMSSWLDKIEEYHLVVKHLIHISDINDYGQLIKRIDNIKNRAVDYSINVLCGLPPVPYMDFAIIGESNLIISFADGAKLFDNAFAIGIMDKNIVAKFKSYFNIYYDGEFSKSVYSRNFSEYYEENLKALEEALLSEYPKSDFWGKNLYLMKSIKHKESYESFLELVNTFKDDLSTLFLEKLKEQANSISGSDITITIEDAWKLLIQIVQKGSIIKAMSNETGNKRNFWETPTGKTFLNANADVVSRKRGSVQRIFITDDENLPIIEEQKKLGIKVKAVSPTNLLAGEEEDFILIDYGFLLKLEEGQAVLSIDPHKITEYNQRFNRIFDN